MEKDEKDLNQENESIVEKDNLMWNEEDYQVMEKITGFDDESIEKDQKKTLRVIIFSLICIALLMIGILIGYNLPREKKDNGFIVNYGNTTETELAINSAYTRKNTSGELYLYFKDNHDEEHSILDLSKYNSFNYNHYNGKLYVLVENIDMTLLEFSLTANGYQSNSIKTFVDRNDNQIFFVNNLIYFVKENQISYYDIVTDKINDLEFDVSECFISSINEKYILFSKDNDTKLYDLGDGTEILIAKNVLLATLEDNNKVLYFTKERSEETVMLYEYLIDNAEKKFVTEVTNDNAMLINYGELYLYNDVNKIYLYNGFINEKIYEFETAVSEISYINDEEIVFISSEYDTEDCALTENKYGVFDVKTKKVSERTIKGCLDTVVINNVIFAK